ncbi:putative tetratricopeptide-like helical domain superfamily, pentacotripeptide-repeat region of PRORP [Helianthus annuus]|nr:putative tetratricopeptide-like helical domain superfamily, pentacotripeptide-repeat region of PRORP [Helianthus annuus]
MLTVTGPTGSTGRSGPAFKTLVAEALDVFDSMQTKDILASVIDGNLGFIVLWGCTQLGVIRKEIAIVVRTFISSPNFFCIFVDLSNGNQPWSLWFYSFISITFRTLFLSQLSQIMFGLKGKFYVMIVKGCGVRRHKSGIGEKVWCIWIIWFWLGLYGWVWLSGVIHKLLFVLIFRKSRWVSLWDIWGGKQWIGRGCVLWGQKFGVIEELWDRYGIAKRQNNKGSGAAVSLHMNGLWFRSVLGWVVRDYKMDGLGLKNGGKFRSIKEIKDSCFGYYEREDVVWYYLFKVYGCSFQNLKMRGTNYWWQWVICYCLVIMDGRSMEVEGWKIAKRLNILKIEAAAKDEKWIAMENMRIMRSMGMHGHANDAQLFKQMQLKGIVPNDVTFVAMFGAFRHARMTEEGRKLLSSMKSVYGVEPKIEHYSCVIALLSRAGRLEEALNLIKNMPIEPNEYIYGALLGGCKIYGDAKVAQSVGKHLLDLDPPHSGRYIDLSNIYAESKRWDDARTTRKLIQDNGVAKMPGVSVIELKEDIAARDRSNIK